MMVKRKTRRRFWMAAIIALAGAAFFAAAAAAQSPPWISGHAVSPAVVYRYRVEQRPGFHQQIHRVIIDLRAADLSMKLITPEGFPRRPQYPSDILEKQNARMCVPAALFTESESRRKSPLGTLRLASKSYAFEDELPFVKLRSMNHVDFIPAGEPAPGVPRILRENGAAIPLAGMNRVPGGPGLYLFDHESSPIPEKEYEDWNVSGALLLKKTAAASEGSESWYAVRQLKLGRDFHVYDDNALLVSIGKNPDPAPEKGETIRVIRDPWGPGSLIRAAFCSGPVFMRDGRYDDGAVRLFCSRPGAPSYEHYSAKKARLALGFGVNRRFLNVFAVDQKGFSREGMTLSELAEYMAAEGVREAVALPDGDAASLILPDGRVNATPPGVEEPVMSALCVFEKKPEGEEVVNLMRRVPVMITASGEAENNPPDAVRDGSFGAVPGLDNYWEARTDDPLHKHGLQIDLLRPYALESLDIFLAGEVGFSSHFNCRLMTLYGAEKDKTELEQIAAIENPRGLSSLRHEFPEGTRLRYLRLVLDEPTAFGDNRSARIAEIAVRGSPGEE